MPLNHSTCWRTMTHTHACPRPQCHINPGTSPADPNTKRAGRLKHHVDCTPPPRRPNNATPQQRASCFARPSTIPLRSRGPRRCRHTPHATATSPELPHHPASSAPQRSPRWCTSQYLTSTSPNADSTTNYRAPNPLQALTSSLSNGYNGVVTPHATSSSLFYELVCGPPPIV